MEKMRSNAKICAEAILTIWSADTVGATHEPPATILTKGMKWLKGANVVMTLVNNEEEVTMNDLLLKMQRRSLKVEFERVLVTGNGTQVKFERIFVI